jgi:hypothetical protein
LLCLIFSKTFCIETDASKLGVGVVLLQEGHPLAFISKPLGPRTQGLSKYEKEYLAILTAIDQWCSYLQQVEFIIYTDQKSLVHLNDQRLNSPWQQRMFTKLVGLQYKIIYKKGVDNGAADALSRKVHTPIHVLALSIASPKWIMEVIASYDQDSTAQAIITKLAIDPAAVPHYTLSDGLLRYKNKVWVGHVPQLQNRIIATLHSSPIGGHSGVPVTLRRIKQYFAWTGMNAAVHSFVSSCSVCQQAKPDRAKYPGLLQPLPIPEGAWQTISMDFVEGLPHSAGKNVIFVVMDKFSKYSHFLALSHPFSAVSVAKLFMTEIYKLHGMPSAIITDRDKIFVSQFWQELFSRAGVELKMSSACHPQTDGQTERVNQCMETFLRCFVHACPKQWYH